MKTETIKISVKQSWQVSRGHLGPKSGSGVHQDRRTKRNRTRSAQRRAALNWS